MATPDLSEFEALVQPQRCAIGAAEDQLTEEDRAKLTVAVERYKSDVILRWLADRGHAGDGFSISGLSHHLRGTCRCKHA